MKRYLLAAIAAFATSIGTAQAVPVTWTLQNWVFDDQGTATGSYVYDADSNVYSAISILTTQGSASPGASYDQLHPTVSSTDEAFSALESGATPPLDGAALLIINMTSPMTNAGGVIPLNLVFLSVESVCGGADCHVAFHQRELISGSIVGRTAVVPLPAAIPLMATALAGLFFAGRKRRQA